MCFNDYVYKQILRIFLSVSMNSLLVSGIGAGCAAGLDTVVCGLGVWILFYFLRLKVLNVKLFNIMLNFS